MPIGTWLTMTTTSMPGFKSKKFPLNFFWGPTTLGSHFCHFTAPPPHAKVLSLNEAQVPSTCRFTQLCQPLSPNESFFPSATIYPPAEMPDFRTQKPAKAGGKLFLFSDLSQILGKSGLYLSINNCRLEMEEISIEGIGRKNKMRHNFTFTREESLLKRKKEHLFSNLLIIFPNFITSWPFLFSSGMEWYQLPL